MLKCHSSTTASSKTPLPVNVRVPVNGNWGPVCGGFIYHVCASFSWDYVAQGAVPATITNTGISVGNLKSGSIGTSGDELVIWSPATVVSQGNITTFSRVGIQGQPFGNEKIRAESGISVNDSELNATLNQRANMSVEYRSDEFWPVAVVVQAAPTVFSYAKLMLEPIVEDTRCFGYC
jgi:hypothetical protein